MREINFYPDESVSAQSGTLLRQQTAEKNVYGNFPLPLVLDLQAGIAKHAPFAGQDNHFAQIFSGSTKEGIDPRITASAKQAYVNEGPVRGVTNKMAPKFPTPGMNN